MLDFIYSINNGQLFSFRSVYFSSGWFACLPSKNSFDISLSVSKTSVLQRRAKCFVLHWIAKRRKWTKNYTERKLETATFDLVSIFQIDELKSCVSAFARLPTFEIRFFAVIIFAYSFASSFYYSVKPRENEVDLIFSW